MDVPADALVSILDILRLEIQSRLVGVRYDKKVEPKRQKSDYGR